MAIASVTDPWSIDPLANFFGVASESSQQDGEKIEAKLDDLFVTIELYPKDQVLLIEVLAKGFALSGSGNEPPDFEDGTVTIPLADMELTSDALTLGAQGNVWVELTPDSLTLVSQAA